ncbi:MAG TPA: c-type cytochrome, partial [Candidatus Acidoferrales bacterium]|nr:c-type cytochrome [Candidatus Acidoferrales bacterium]
MLNKLREGKSSRDSRGAIIFALLLLAGISLGERLHAQATAPTAPQAGDPAEKVFRNIQVFKGMPASEVQGAMSFIASSLGVDCDYCHVQDKEGTFASDAEPAKLRAREMILMVRRINDETFHGQNVVNCFTCHQGATKPVSIATVLALRAPRPAAAPADSAAAAALPSVQEVLDHYVKALGGQEALDRVKTRIIKFAPLMQASGDTSLNEVMQKAPGKVLILNQSPGYTVRAGFDGKQAWAQDSLKSYWGILSKSQLHSVMRDAEMYAGSRLRNGYSDVKVTGSEVLGDRNVYVIAGTSPEGTREKFYFNSANGLLLKRHIEEPTAFGWFPLDTTYEGYREVDGVKIPFVVRITSAGGAWGIRTSYMILEVHQNVPIS